MRLLSLVLLALGLAGASAVPAAAATYPTVSIGPAQVAEGNRLYFPICVSSATPRTTYTQVYLETHSGTAKPVVDYVYEKVKLNIKPSVTCIKGMVQTVDNSAVDGSRTMTGQISAVRYAVIGTAQATGTINDNDVAPVPVPPAPIPTPVPTPTPAPIPAPAPAPAPGGWVPTPSLAGFPPIASNFDTSAYLTAAPIPASAAPDVVGAFRFICGPGQVLADDPIVYPGQPGASHLHQFYGNTGANAFSTYSSLRTTGESTCMGLLNRSAYWMPALLDGKGNAVRPDYVAIYYKQRPVTDPIVSDPANPRYQGKAVPLPNGLRFIFGRNMLNPAQAPTGAAYFNCDGPTAIPGHYLSLTEALKNCPAGNRVGAIIIAPDCWDGKNLDSPDHRSHVAYAGYGTWGYFKCPTGFPYVIPAFTLGAWYAVLAGDDTTQWSLSSDAMFPNEPKGSTLHADWFGAWDDATMAMWTLEGCIGKMLNCSAGVLGNGSAMKQVAPFSWNASPRLVPVPAQ